MSKYIYLMAHQVMYYCKVECVCVCVGTHARMHACAQFLLYSYFIMPFIYILLFVICIRIHRTV